MLGLHYSKNANHNSDKAEQEKQNNDIEYSICCNSITDNIDEGYYYYILTPTYHISSPM